MILPFIALIAGLLLLVWSADRFVDGAASTAKFFSISPLIIGMVIVGFGTSAPEMFVSALAGLSGNTGIALGNAYGSNVANIGLILGVSALISPIVVHSNILKKELPILAFVTLVTLALLVDQTLSRVDAFILLALFFLIMGYTIYSGIKDKNAPSPENEANKEVDIKKSVIWLLIGLVMLIASSRLLVWGATEIAQLFGVSDMIIGLTVVAIGTSLPELASSVIAARKGEDDIALGNVIGSNLFNTLAVVGIAGSIHPFAIEPATLTRDMPVMIALTFSLFLLGFAMKGNIAKINRLEGALLLFAYVAYTGYLVYFALQA